VEWVKIGKKLKEKGDVKKVLSKTYRFFILLSIFMIFQSSSNKIGRQKTLFLSGLFATLFMIFFLFSKTTFTMFLSLSLIGLFVFANRPVLLALVHDLKTDMPTQVNSIYGNKFWSYILNCFLWVL